jgi:putative FmdB family regulatory protein
MPVYEYRCEKCTRRFSILVGMTAEKAPLRCPRCGSTRATKLISQIAPIVREEGLDDLGDLDDSDLGGAGEDLDDYNGGYDGDFDD